MSRSKKPRKPAWYNRWPNQACIQATLVTRRGTHLGITRSLSDDEASKILDILIPPAKPPV